MKDLCRLSSLYHIVLVAPSIYAQYSFETEDLWDVNVTPTPSSQIAIAISSVYFFLEMLLSLFKRTMRTNSGYGNDLLFHSLMGFMVYGVIGFIFEKGHGILLMLHYVEISTFFLNFRKRALWRKQENEKLPRFFSDREESIRTYNILFLVSFVILRIGFQGYVLGYVLYLWFPLEEMHLNVLVFSSQYTCI